MLLPNFSDHNAINDIQLYSDHISNNKNSIIDWLGINRVKQDACKNSRFRIIKWRNDNKFIAIAINNFVIFFDAEHREFLEQHIRHDHFTHANGMGEILSLCWANETNSLLIGTRSAVCYCRLHTLSLHKELEVADMKIFSSPGGISIDFLIPCPQSRLFLTGCRSQDQLYLWDCISGDFCSVFSCWNSIFWSIVSEASSSIVGAAAVKQIGWFHSSSVNGIDWSPCGRHILVIASDGNVSVVETYSWTSEVCCHTNSKIKFGKWLSNAAFVLNPSDTTKLFCCRVFEGEHGSAITSLRPNRDKVPAIRILGAPYELKLPVFQLHDGERVSINSLEIHATGAFMAVTFEAICNSRNNRMDIGGVNSSSIVDGVERKASRVLPVIAVYRLSIEQYLTATLISTYHPPVSQAVGHSDFSSSNTQVCNPQDMINVAFPVSVSFSSLSASHDVRMAALWSNNVIESYTIM